MMCANNNTNLEEASQWAEYAINGNYIGEKNFTTLSVKAKIVGMMGKTMEHDSLMKEAIAVGNMNDIQDYAQQLMTAKKSERSCRNF